MNFRIVFLVCFGVPLLWAGGVKVPEEADMVFLKNGRVIKGTVICSGSKNVVILVNEQEKTVSRDEVNEIKHGKKSMETTSYLTGNVDGLEQIVGKGEYTPPPPEPKTEKKTASGEPAAAKVRKPKEAGNSSTPAGGSAGSGITPGTLKKLLENNPALRDKLKNIKDTKKLEEMLQKNNVMMNKDVYRILNELSK